MDAKKNWVIEGEWKKVYYKEKYDEFKIDDLSSNETKIEMPFRARHWAMVKSEINLRSEGVSGSINFFSDIGTDFTTISYKDVKRVGVREEILKKAKVKGKDLSENFIIKDRVLVSFKNSNFNISFPLDGVRVTETGISLLGRDFLNICSKIIMNLKKNEFSLYVPMDSLKQIL